MAWGKHGPLPISNFTSPHECVNWDRLMEWVEPRSFDAFEEGMLVHPKFGPAFIDGEPANHREDDMSSGH
ncbi:hypothetical protein MMC14_003837 [Varicellaria rhodocarpa]|nr:hypothetical protein [Varicellaria rhodocarpa]